MKHDEPIKAAIFDLGGVVIDICVDEIFRHWASAAGLDSEHAAGLFELGWHKSFERGEISSDQFHQLVVDRLGAAISFEQLEHGWNSMLQGVIGGIEDLLDELSHLVRLALLSNTNELHVPLLMKRCHEPLGYFEKIFLSHEMGTRKPEPACYQTVLDWLGLAARQVVFIDDHPPNVAAAESLGMSGIIAANPPQIAADLRRMGIGLQC